MGWRFSYASSPAARTPSSSVSPIKNSSLGGLSPRPHGHFTTEKLQRTTAKWSQTSQSDLITHFAQKLPRVGSCSHLLHRLITRGHSDTPVLTPSRCCASTSLTTAPPPTEAHSLHHFCLRPNHNHQGQHLDKSNGHFS